MRIIRRASLFFIACLLLSAVQPALAHGYIVRAIPDDRAVLQRAPTRLQYWFSESLEPGFSSINVRDQTGKVIATGSVAEDDSSLMTVRLPSGLPDGAYIVELRPAFSSDGHVVAESRVFFVGQEVGGVEGSEASADAVPLEVVWRAILLASTMLLFGVFALYSGILLPAWGSKQYPAGLLPPRVMHRLNWIVIGALVVAFAANILALIQQTMVFFSVDAVQVFSQGLWDVVRIGSRFGDVWNARMLLLALIAVLHGASIYMRKGYPETVRAFWTGNVWLMALVIGTSTVASHAAGSLLWPWLAMPVDWLHAIGVAFWVGGIIALVLVLPVALQPYQGEARRQALLTVMRRFSRWAVASVFIVITTGLYNALNWFYTPNDLTQTTYGDALLLKGLLVAMLLLVGALHHIALHPEWIGRVERGAAFLGPVIRRRANRYLCSMAQWAERFAVSLRLEVVLSIVVLVSVGLLSATPIPEPDFAKTTADTPSATQTVDGLTVAMTISPGGPGVNTYDTQVFQGGQPLDGLDVRLQMVNPARDWRSSWENSEPVDSGLYVTAGDDIDRAGEWWSVLNISDGTNTTRVAFDWTISSAASVLDSRDPGVLNFLALAGVLAAMGWAAYPTLRRYFRQLDLSPVAVTVSVGVTVIAIALLALGFIIVQDAQQRYDETLYPPPKVVNIVLPDATSVNRGRELYLANCIVWQSDSTDFAALRNSLSLARDDELYMATMKGWRNLPPCTDDLTSEERWDIVNYFRTLDRAS